MGVDAAGLIHVGLEALEAGRALGQLFYPNIVSGLRTGGVIDTGAFGLYIDSQGPYIKVPLESVIGGLT